MRRSSSLFISTSLTLTLTLSLFAASCTDSDSDREIALPETTHSDPVLAELDPESYFVNYGADRDANRTLTTSVVSGTPASDASSSDDGGGEAMVEQSFEVAESPPEPAEIAPPEVPEIDPPTVTEDNTFTEGGDNPFVNTAEETTSTFGLDVDTGSYNVADRLIREGFRPPTSAVRVEEYLNYFDYDYAAPQDAALGATVDGVLSPYVDGTHIVRVGVNTQAVDPELRSPAAITMVVDVSGSMDIRERLGLVQSSLALMVKQLQPDDTIAIVTYSGDGGVVLEPTPVAESQKIVDAIDSLTPGGGTNLEAGLRTGYRLANESYRDDAVNIVLLASDGVANIGDTGPDSITSTIGQESANGINLVTVGYGMGNFNDTLMEQLADQGDGFYSYLDDFSEAEVLFQDQLTQTLVPVARDAKVQVEFDPAQVAEYRLIGYENRALDNEDFRNDAVDAGELGSGHSATALYQIRRTADATDGAMLGTVRLRWEDPNTAEITEVDVDINASDLVSTDDQSESLRLATTVASFAEVLAEHPASEERAVTLADLAETANELSTAQPNNQRLAEFAEMANRANRAAPYPSNQ